MKCPMDELKNKCDMSINAVSISNKKEENIACGKNTDDSGNHARMKSVGHRSVHCRVFCDHSLSRLPSDVSLWEEGTLTNARPAPR